MQNKFITMLLLVFLTACASSHAILVNDEGHEVECNVESFGILFPHIAAKDKFDKCIKDAEAKGYKIKTKE